jgi:hypothetical protein
LTAFQVTSQAASRCRSKEGSDRLNIIVALIEATTLLPAYETFPEVSSDERRVSDKAFVVSEASITVVKIPFQIDCRTRATKGKYRD